MNKTAAPKSTPNKTHGESGAAMPKTEFRNVFIGAALNMSWKLAITVLVPVLLGYKLDQHFKISPILTLLGFAIAIIGVVLVLRRVLQEVSGGTK